MNVIVERTASKGFSIKFPGGTKTGISLELYLKYKRGEQVGETAKRKCEIIDKCYEGEI